MDVLTWIKRGGRGRADRVAREGGLDGVEAWAVREISDCEFFVFLLCFVPVSPIPRAAIIIFGRIMDVALLCTLDCSPFGRAFCFVQRCVMKSTLGSLVSPRL
jgi:hypothetical protein